MKFGAPPTPIRSPSLPSTCPTSKTEPSATWTSGLARTFCTTERGTVGSVLPSSVLMNSFAVTATSVPLLASWKIVSKLPLIVSV